MFNPDQFILDSIPSTCFYIPNFITEGEEKLLVHNIEKTSSLRWTQLKNRRLINFGGVPTQKGMIAEEIPRYLQNYVDKVNELGVFKDVNANHILLNEYHAGQVRDIYLVFFIEVTLLFLQNWQGIMPHFDGPLFYPTITTLSVGSHAVLEFNKPRSDDDDISEKNPVFKILVEPRSLLVLQDDLYRCFMHSISEVDEDNITDPLIRNLDRTSFAAGDVKILQRSTRFSLTIRNVPKTSKLKLKFGK